MITQTEEYKKMISHRLEENVKSFKLLYAIQHYGNCISIMCQELDQMISLLFILNSSAIQRKQFMESSNNSHKLFILSREGKKEYITDEILLKYADTLTGWDKSIYEFGFAFSKLSNNFNYGSKDPIKSMGEADRTKLLNYVQAYHSPEFPPDFSLNDLIPILPAIIEQISLNLKKYMEKLQ
jgi:hypothetical protein